MSLLPQEFTSYTRQLMGDERFERYLKAFEEETPVSIRLNPLKSQGLRVIGGEQVPWCPEGYYLPRRPNFTADPLLHAGCYYVQEAASMFVSHVLSSLITSQIPLPSLNREGPGEGFGLLVLDLCAAPGGKSTAAIAALPQGSTLYANEPIRSRASILLENITKWGYPNCTVTNNYPRDYRASKLSFDIILCDVPCSGEGMFRRDAATIREWSLQNVERCQQLQRQIVSDAWACLNDGGLLVYSTCTFNTRENEENIRWMLNEFDDAQVLPVDTKPEWNITGSLLPGFDYPVYRFIPGITRGEGLFICAVRKIKRTTRPRPTPGPSLLREGRKISKSAQEHLHILLPSLNREGPGVGLVGCSLSYPQAIAYLRGESLTLPPDTPRGIVEVSFMGHPLGLAKNIGTRANNLYPKEWRIKTTHTPTDYEAILEHT